MTSFRPLAAALAASLLLAGCASSPEPKPAQPPKTVEPKPDTPDKPSKARRVFTDRIPDADTFAHYSRQVGTDRFTKFVIDVRTGEIWYFDVNVYKLHVDFVFAELYREKQTPQRILDFNQNYEREKPEFMLCYLVHHLQSDVWTFSFWEGDLVTPEQVKTAYERLQATFYMADKVKFRPDSTLQEGLTAGVKALDIGVVTNDQIYKASKYQPFSKGRAVGRLKIVGSVKDATQLAVAEDEIVILTEIVPDITPVRGIVSEQFSTPLSHVALRARAWGIPHVGYKGASKEFGGLAGKVVLLEARGDGLTLREATPEEIAADEKARAAAKVVRLPDADLTQRELKLLPAIGKEEAGAYGAKTANLGEIAGAKLGGFNVPAGFGVPIAWYADHMKRHGFDARVAALLKDPAFLKDRAVRKAKLKALREAIVAAPIDEALAEKVREGLEKIGAAKAKRGVFVRSSTNAEDLPGFNGAGLYDTVPNVKGGPGVLDAIKAVWASVWNLRAFEERQHFGIDHGAVYGAVLVQLGVDATAAGVIVTANIFDPPDRRTYTINAKSGLGIRVVEGKKVPEQLLFDTGNLGIRVLSRSDEDTMLVFDDEGGVREVPNPNKGKPVLTDTRAMVLALAARDIATLFGGDDPLDIEWLFEGDTLHIVQARPYLGL